MVGSSQAPVNIDFTAYGDESDPGPMPVPADAPIEGDPNPGSGDRHVLVLDNANCWMYEPYSSHPNADGSWNAGSAAVWDLLADKQRPWTWTSADAAGLPIFAGLARYDEVASGQIRHALRFTLAQSQAAFVPPASHWDANSSNASAAPMGMRLRLKASYDISGFSANNQVILTALPANACARYREWDRWSPPRPWPPLATERPSTKGGSLPPGSDWCPASTRPAARPGYSASASAATFTCDACSSTVLAPCFCE